MVAKLGVKYHVILVYADDIYFLLSPSFYGLQKMLNICNMFGEDNGLHLNAKKTKCIAFHKKHEQLITEQCTMSHEICMKFAFALPKCKSKLL